MTAANVRQSRIATLDRATLATAAVLFGLLGCAAVVRLIGIDSGRPFAYHPDEWIVFKPAMTMVHERDWNPHLLWYPSLLVDMQAGLTAAIRWLGGPPIVTDQPWLFGPDLLPDQFRYLLAGRVMVMALGLATIATVFVIGRQLRGSFVGLAAAGLLAAMPLHISDSRHLTTDVPVALFCAATLMLTLKASTGRRERWWLAAGIAAGLAISTKWNGAIVLGVPLLAYFLGANGAREAAGRLRRRTPYLIVATALVTVAVTTPAVVLDLTTVLEFARLNADIYAQERPRIASDSLALNLQGLGAGMGPITATVALAGLARFLLRPRLRVELVIPVFVLVNLVVLSLPPRQYDRNLIPMLPYLAVAAACLLGDLPGMVRGVTARSVDPGLGRALGRAVGVGAIALLVAGLALGFGAGSASGERASQLDTRTIARDWILANVARKTVIARERDTPFLAEDEYRLRPFRYLTFHSLDWYRDAGTQLMVTSSLAYGAFVENPATPQPDAWYQALFALPEVFRVEPGPDHPGPTIRIYRLAPFESPPDGTGGRPSDTRSSPGFTRVRDARPAGP